MARNYRKSDRDDLTAVTGQQQCRKADFFSGYALYSVFMGLCRPENMEKTMSRARTLPFIRSAVPAGESGQAVGSTSSSWSVK